MEAKPPGPRLPIDGSCRVLPADAGRRRPQLPSLDPASSSLPLPLPLPLPSSPSSSSSSTSAMSSSSLSPASSAACGPMASSSLNCTADAAATARAATASAAPRAAFRLVVINPCNPDGAAPGCCPPPSPPPPPLPTAAAMPASARPVRRPRVDVRTVGGDAAPPLLLTPAASAARERPVSRPSVAACHDTGAPDVGAPPAGAPAATAAAAAAVVAVALPPRPSVSQLRVPAGSAAAAVAVGTRGGRPVRGAGAAAATGGWLGAAAAAAAAVSSSASEVGEVSRLGDATSGDGKAAGGSRKEDDEVECAMMPGELLPTVGVGSEGCARHAVGNPRRAPGARVSACSSAAAALNPLPVICGDGAPPPPPPPPLLTSMTTAP